MTAIESGLALAAVSQNWWFWPLIGLPCLALVLWLLVIVKNNAIALGLTKFRPFPLRVRSPFAPFQTDAQRNSNPNVSPQGYNPEHDLLYDPRQEDIVLNRWRLENILDEIERAKNKPKVEDAFPWVGVALAFFYPIISADFKTVVLSEGTWKAISVIGAAYSCFNVVLIWWRVARRRKETVRTAQQIVQELVEEMR